MPAELPVTAPTKAVQTMVKFHPPEELLVDYASGGLGTPWAVLIASHLTLCTECREAAGELDQLGGLFLDETSADGLSAGLLERTLAALDRDDAITEPAMPTIAKGASSTPLMPLPLARYLGMGCDTLGWRTILPGVQEYAPPVGRGMGRPAMLRIRAGRTVPMHTHRGDEAIIVLAGGFSDGAGHYSRGDVSWADGRHEHRPVADLNTDCICFTVTDAPVLFTGPVGRVLNLFNR